MPFTPEQNERILAALKERFGGEPPCPLCRRHSWMIAPGYLSLAFSDDPNSIALRGPGVTFILIACMHCGNTHFLNAAALGPLEPTDRSAES
jgi:hypothetical protein